MTGVYSICELEAGIDTLSQRCGFPIVENRPQVLATIGNKVERLEAANALLRAMCDNMQAENARLREAIGTAPCPVVQWREDCQKDTECKPDCWKRSALEVPP